MSFLGMEGLTTGLIFAIIILLTQWIMWIKHIIAICQAPYPNFSADGSHMEVSDKLSTAKLLEQLGAHLLAVGLWLAFAYFGAAPIILADGRYFTIHLLVISFLVCHQTINIQVCHVTL